MDLNGIYSRDIAWAVVGDVDNHEKYAYKILKNFKSKGYKVVGVNPYNRGEVPSTLEEVDYNLVGINLCINPTKGAEILKKDSRHNIKYVIAQPGARSLEIENICKEKGIEYIETCTLVTLPEK